MAAPSASAAASASMVAGATQGMSPSATIHDCAPAALAEGAVIAAPVFNGRRGNPAGFSAALLPELLALRGDEGARSLFERHAFAAVSVADAGVLRDVDHPADL